MGRIGGLVSRAALLALATLTLAGCQYLFGSGFGPLPPEPLPSELAPQPSALYTTGSATVTIGTDPVIELATLSEGGAISPEFGVGATFRNDEGWYVRLEGVTKGINAYASYVSIERIADHQHWTTFDPSGCTFTIDSADASGLSGKATCTGLRWADAMTAGLGTGYKPPYIDGQAPFDAVITFEAAPAASSASGAPSSTQPG